MKILFISDTHGQHPSNLPTADLLVHCGDLTTKGDKKSFETEISWLRSIKDNYPLGIIYVPGNHDLGLEMDSTQKSIENWIQNPLGGGSYYKPKKRENILDEVMKLFDLAGIKVLINSGLEIEGIKFWGSPYTPPFMDWAFMASESELSKFWGLIPEETQVLITHGPAQELRDLCPGGHVGSSSLRYHLDYRLNNLKVHSFGHIHEGFGVHQQGRYLCLNASVLDGRYQGFNPFMVVDTDNWTCTEYPDTTV